MEKLTLDEWYQKAIEIFNSMPNDATIIQIRKRIALKIGPRPEE